MAKPNKRVPKTGTDRAGVIYRALRHAIIEQTLEPGDCSLIRMANLYANIARLGRTKDIAGCLDMVTSLPAKLMNLVDYGIAPGNVADIVVLDCRDSRSAVAELAQPLFALKDGRKTFSRAPPTLHRPD